MRILIAAIAIIGLAVCAYAQPGGDGMDTPGGHARRRGPPPEPKTAPRADEKAYRSALERLPDKKNEKFDPWGGVREVPKSK
jgi:hypothetical protein